jgi:hypothetical protein
MLHEKLCKDASTNLSRTLKLRGETIAKPKN